VVRINSQRKLSELPKKCRPLPKKPEKLLNWEETRPELKKFLLLHVIKAIEENQDPYFKLTKRRLVEILSKDMDVVEEQVRIYVENLIYYGYLAETYLHELTFTDKVYDDLQAADRFIRKRKFQENDKKIKKKTNKEEVEG